MFTSICWVKSQPPGKTVSSARLAISSTWWWSWCSLPSRIPFSTRLWALQVFCCPAQPISASIRKRNWWKPRICVTSNPACFPDLIPISPCCASAPWTWCSTVWRIRISPIRIPCPERIPNEISILSSWPTLPLPAACSKRKSAKICWAFARPEKQNCSL